MIDSKVYFETDCDRSVLKDKRIAVVGYGSQGRAFVLNLRDSGCDVSVLLRLDSSSGDAATGEGVKVDVLTSITDFDVIIFAFPDHEQPSLYYEFFSNDAAMRHFVLLHGSNFHFGNIAFRENHDVILVAPHGPGSDLRENYLDGSGLSCFLAVGQDSSTHAKAIGLALAASIGAGKAGIFETTFKDETIGDLFGEQTLLVGGMAGLTDAVFRTMVDKGIPPANAYLETIKQLRLLAAMIEKFGPAGMIERVSKTAGFGSLLAIPSLFDQLFQQRLEAIFYAIRGGEFNQLLTEEAQNGFQMYDGLLRLMKQRESQKISEEFSNKENEQ
ncbi:MAG: ketol-acid reductoisomerase [Candidatus Zixiibacteriota bacterium]